MQRHIQILAQFQQQSLSLVRHVKRRYPRIPLDMMNLRDLQTPTVLANIIDREILSLCAADEVRIFHCSTTCIAPVRYYWRKWDALWPFD